MNFLDLLIVIPLIWFGYKGFRNGLVMELVSILSLIAGIYIAIRFSAWVGQQLGIRGDYAATVSFIVTFLAVLLGTYLLGKCIDGLVKMLSLGFLNRLGGLLIGLFKTALVVGLLIFCWNRIDRQQHILTPEIRNHSVLFRPMETLSYQIWPVLDALNERFQNIGQACQEEPTPSTL